MAVEGFEVCLVGRETVVDGDFASAGLVEYGDLYAIAEAGGSVADDNIDVLDEAVVLNVVVGDVVLDVLDAAVIADGDIVQRGMEDAGVLMDAAGHFETLLETSQMDFAGEACGTDVLQAGLVGDVDGAPVIRRTALFLQLADLVRRDKSCREWFHVFSK